MWRLYGKIPFWCNFQKVTPIDYFFKEDNNGNRKY